MNKPNKECVFVNGICKEQYDDCKNADYYGCSSVIIFNEYKEVVYTQKCEWDWEYHEWNTVGSRHLYCIKNFCMMVGYPKILQSDNGLEYKNNIIKNFCENNNLKQIFSAPRHPETNGVIEVSHKELRKNIICFK